MKKFRRGQKVVPKSYKTGDHGCTLNRSAVWDKAKQKRQPYLWVQRVTSDFHIECSDEKEGGCDFFYLADLEPYKANQKKDKYAAKK